ncbi:MAG: hypothetical protein HWD58_19130 [Bacteroidota bacterium]|nr:MAG: hypothetical protein HWD58_19130 [Bacteroidota bacterium]
MTIEHTSKEIIFKVPKNTKIEDLQDLANLFEFKQLARKSKATQKQLDTLLSESKREGGKALEVKLAYEDSC